jgi:hypothetical protein
VVLTRTTRRWRVAEGAVSRQENGIVMADLQFTAWIILSDGDEYKGKLGDIRGCNLSLELWRIDCSREYVSEESGGGF